MKIIAVISLVVALIIAIALSTNCNNSNSSTNGDNNGNSKNSVSWVTDYVSLEADDFYIVADGKNYYANVEEVDVDSDPGTDDFTLEVEWEENGVEMRLFIYFYADQSHWWSDEIRTYDGQVDGDWICYTGMFFETSLGDTFAGDVDLQSDEDNDYEGAIHFENLTLQSFGNGNGNGNGTPTITGEIIGFRTLVSELPTGTTSYKYYTPFVEDGDGNIFMLFSEGMSIDYEYDGMSMSGATIEIAGFTYSDTLSNCENINVGGITRRISHTGIQAAITGIIDTVTSGYMEFEGDRIHVETIDELP